MNWDIYFMGMAEYISTKSKDPNTKVGAVIVGPDKEIRSTGYNGMPRGVLEHLNPERYERPEKYFWIEHAERNAIYNAARMGISLKGCTLYHTPMFPCSDCCRGIIQVGIVEVVSPDMILDDKWGQEALRSKQMFKEAGIKVRYI